MPFVLPEVGSRGDQWRETLMIEFGVPTNEADLLIRYDPELFWGLQPDTADFQVHQSENLWIDVATNSLGQRDDELREPRSERQLRVLCVGDSCTYGSGVRREESWPDQLERLLPRDRFVEVINAGVPGYSAYQGVRYLERDGLALEPDIVIFTLGFNDRRSWGGLSDAEHAAFARAQDSFLARQLNRSRLVQVVRHLLKTAQGKRSVDRSQQVRTRPRVSLSEYRALLARAASRTAAAGARILYVLWPVSSNIASEQPALTSHQLALIEFCAETGNPLVNPIDRLRPHSRIIYLDDDVHMTMAGNRIMAKSIRSALRELNWLDN